jgi:hypothetical protein
MIKYLIELKKYVQFSQNEGIPRFILYIYSLLYCTLHTEHIHKKFGVCLHKTTRSMQWQETIIKRPRNYTATWTA